MKKFILGSLCTAVMAFSGSAMAANFVAGKDYTVVANPVKVEVPARSKSVSFSGMAVRTVLSLNRICRPGLKDT